MTKIPAMKEMTVTDYEFYQFLKLQDPDWKSDTIGEFTRFICNGKVEAVIKYKNSYPLGRKIWISIPKVDSLFKFQIPVVQLISYRFAKDKVTCITDCPFNQIYEYNKVVMKVGSYVCNKCAYYKGRIYRKVLCDYIFAQRKIKKEKGK